MFRFLPEQASEVAPKVDAVNNFITDVSVFFTIAIVGSMIYFAIRYRRRGESDHPTPQIRGNSFLEIVWTAVPSAVLVYLLFVSFIAYKEIREVPEGALEIATWGSKWKWDFEYSNGKKTTGLAVIPVGKPVKFITKSRDVIHSFFIPAMRVKRDVLPHQFNYVSFTPVKTGEYQIFCTEYCGLEHWNMLAKLKVVSAAEYELWLHDTSEELLSAGMPPEERGKALYQEKGCVACHSLNGTPGVGPSFLKLYGRKGSFTDGTAYEANENYLMESILQPEKHIVSGYSAGMMPAFEGTLGDEQIADLIAFIKSLDGTAALIEQSESEPIDTASMSPAERGEKLYQAKTCSGCHALDGTAQPAPSFKGLYGKSGTLTSGKSYVANDEYLARSIKEPAGEVVEGYQPIMPPIALSDEEVQDLIAFIKDQS